MVGRAGVGVDNIDIEASTENGVIVMNTPTGNTIATAELTFTHMLAGTRPIVQACARMREGGWGRKEFGGSELNQKTLGVLGMGRIGAEVAKRAMAFQMEVLAYDPYLTESRANALGVKMATLDEVIENADYTTHMPLTKDTKHMLNADAFARMKDSVRVFNCARGGIIEEAALIEALKSGKVAAAGLDVYETSHRLRISAAQHPEPCFDSAPRRFDCGSPGKRRYRRGEANDRSADRRDGDQCSEYAVGGS